MRPLRKLSYYGYSVLELILGVKNWPKIFMMFFRNMQQKEQVLKLRNPEIEMLVRGRMDVWSVKETFLDSFYTRYGTSVLDGWTVVDIGAGIGDFSIYAAHGKPGAIVYACEPFPSSYHILNQNLKLNGINNVVALQKAVWSFDGRLILDLSGGEPLQIVSQDQDNELKESNAIEVEAISLKSLIEDHNIGEIDLLKLDCEGAEYEILMQADGDCLAKIRRMILEYHDLDHNRNHHHLTAFLKQSGYKVQRYDNFIHDDIGYLYVERV
jgi:FkbM family methyltransferase